MNKIYLFVLIFKVINDCFHFINIEIALNVWISPYKTSYANKIKVHMVIIEYKIEIIFVFFIQNFIFRIQFFFNIIDVLTIVT